MNKKQGAYQMGRVFYNYSDVIFLAAATGWGCDSLHNFDSGQILTGSVEVAVGLYATWGGALSGAARGFAHLELKKIKSQREEYPLEHAERVVMDDVKGLEFLLSETAEGEEVEWGTLLRAHGDKGRAVIYEVLDMATGKENGLIGRGTKTRLSLQISRANREGYSGFHHYHPDIGSRWFWAHNFSVGLIDRFKPENWINLLTFNLPEGPEIIGFNRQHTYIPKDKSKRELVRATPQQIREYLAA